MADPTGELTPDKIEGSSQPPENPTSTNDTKTAHESGTSLNKINQQVSAEGAQSPSFNARPGERNVTLEDQNREKMLASGELLSDTPAELAQQKVNLFTYGVESPNFSAAISSDNFADKVDSQKEDIDRQLKDTRDQLSGNKGAEGEIEQPKFKEFQDFSGEIQSARDTNREILERTKATIEADFQAREFDQKAANRQRTGFSAKTLARMGALGTTTSGLSYLQQVDTQNQQELTKLLAQKEELLIAADQAYMANDWTLLSAKMAENKAITNQYNEIQQEIFENKLKTADQLMEQARFGWEREDRAMGKMASFVETGIEINEDNEEDIRKLEIKAGVPEGTYEKLTDINKKAQAVDEIQSDLEFQQDMVDLLNKIPEGQSVKIGDTLYSGWKKAEDNMWKSTSTDSQGNVTGINFDPSSGVWSTVNLGNIGKSSEGWKQFESGGQIWAHNANTNEVRPVTTKGGYVDPSGYSGFDQWRQSIGVTTVEFGGGTQFENMHPGWDMAGAVGDPITAFIGGEVINVNNSGVGAYGNFVEIRDAEGKVWQYSHLDTSAVQVGQTIRPGEYIGGMGATGNISTKYGLDAEGNRIVVGQHEATDAEKAAGLGAHLDLRVKMDGRQLESDEKPDEVVPGLDDSYFTGIQADINQIRSMESREDIEQNYTQIREQVARQGKDALAWFDKTYPADQIVGTLTADLPKFSDLTEQKLAGLAPNDILSIAKRDGVQYGQLVSILGLDGIRAFSDDQALEIALETGASKKEIFDIFQKGSFLTDRLTSELKDEIEKRLKERDSQ